MTAPDDKLSAALQEEMRRNRAFFEQQLNLNREVIRDNAEAFREGSRVVRESASGVAQVMVGVGDVMTEVAEALRELRAEVRAQSEAIFKLIDRLDGGASPSEAG